MLVQQNLINDEGLLQIFHCFHQTIIEVSLVGIYNFWKLSNIKTLKK